MVEWIQVQPKSPEWFALRAQDLTASELPAVAGVGLYGTAYQVWATKAGLADPVEENDAMQRGDWLECAVPVALQKQCPDEFAIDYPLNIYLRDHALRLGGTPDAAGVDRDSRPVGFEFKVVSRQSYERHWIDGEPPVAFKVQLLTNSMLMDCHYGILAALVLGFQDIELVVHRVDRHAAAEAGIRDLARRFWEAFDEGRALVPPDYARDADILRQVFRPDKDKPAPIDLSADNRLAEVLVEREDLRLTVDRGKKMLKEFDAEIIHKLAGAEAALHGNWKISHTMTHREAYWQAESNYPTLRITKPKVKAA